MALQSERDQPVKGPSFRGRVWYLIIVRACTFLESSLYATVSVQIVVHYRPKRWGQEGEFAGRLERQLKLAEDSR